jgi:hypothetical protein
MTQPSSPSIFLSLPVFLRRLLPLVALAAITTCPIEAAPEAPITLQSLLEEMINPDHLALWPEPAFVTHQASSYDRRSKTPKDPDGWFANNDFCQFIRMETVANRHEWVMMDADGPGCVDRFWTGGKDATGIVRFYLDGAAQPVIEAPLSDLLFGKNFVPSPLAYKTPHEAGNMYVPIPFAKHCKITYDEPDPTNPLSPSPARWYNIEYRTYPKQVQVQTFTKEDFASQADLVKKVGDFLAGPWTAPEGSSLTLDKDIEPGQEIKLQLPPGSHAIRQLNFNLVGVAPDQVIAAHRATVLVANFDGESTIWCPVSDFFGSGVGINVLTNWVDHVTADGKMSNRWVMPYRQSGFLALHNFGKQKVTVHLEAIVDSWSWTNRSMYFHSTWHDQTDIHTRPFLDWNYLTASGRGTYMGDTLSVYNSADGWFGEGDEKIWIDKDDFPSHFGTGTEDYYGSAWSFPELYESCFSNLVLRPHVQGYIGETSVTRVRDLDAITFTSTIKHDMEIWHWKDCTVDYTVANYWYALPGATSTTVPMPEAVVRPIK